MIIEQIQLHNFRAFKGKHTIDLEPPNSRQPITLIGALNGSGKTTLLMAIQLVLYGRQSTVWKKDNRAYPQFLLECINRMVDPADGAGIELQFRHVFESEEHTVRVLRYWKANGNGTSESLEVFVDGQYDPVCSENWADWVEDFIPSRIAPLFFFDGEKIEELADPAQSKEILTAAIKSLLGLDILEQLDADLRILERRTRKNMATKEELAEITALELEYEKASDVSGQLAQDIASVQTESSRISKALADAEQKYKKAGGRTYEQANALKISLKNLKEQKVATRAKLVELAGGPMPFLLVEDLLRRCLNTAAEETESSSSPELMEMLQIRDQELLEVLSKLKLSQSSIGKIDRHLETDRGKREDCMNQNPRILDLDSTAKDQLEHLLAAELPIISKTSNGLVLQLESIQTKMLHVRRELESLPAEEQIRPIQEHIRSLESELMRTQARHELLLESQVIFRREVETKLAILENTKVRRETETQTHEDNERVLTYSQRARTTLREFSRSTLVEHIERIQSLVLDSVQQLFRKKNMIRDLRIDPETFDIEILNSDGLFISPESLSAGERQLLATSLLWGLSRAAGRSLPVVIDTPLGRLDKSHRNNLVSRYFPRASHQVILLSTDEEIVGDLIPPIVDSIGRTYTLMHDDDLQTTTIQEGYLFEAAS